VLGQKDMGPEYSIKKKILRFPTKEFACPQASVGENDIFSLYGRMGSVSYLYKVKHIDIRIQGLGGVFRKTVSLTEIQPN